MKINSKYILFLIAGFFAVSCTFLSGCTNEEMLDDEEETPKTSVLKATHLRLENGSKNIVIETVLTQDIGDVRLDSDSIKVLCNERNIFDNPYTEKTQPVFTSITHAAVEQLVDNHIFINVLVDLTLPKSAVEDERNALILMRRLIPSANMKLIFMTESGLSEAMEATDYVIDTYCVAKENSEIKKLYKSIFDSIRFTIDCQKSASSETKSIFVAFSDGKVYHENKPIDPEHFNRQDDLMHLCSSLGTSITFYYVSFDVSGNSLDSADFIYNLCNKANGLYQNMFNWAEMQKRIFSQFCIEYSDYTIVLTNPDDKVYAGKKHMLTLQFLKDERVVAELETQYSNGCFYRPIIVNGKSYHQVMWLGILLAFAILALIYIFLQIIVPKIEKIIFDHKYVTRYKRNMTLSGVIVDTTCYYCKAPFTAGDKIVARCCHTMHEQCWNENGYHCPEYGKNCKHGSHYYNPDNLLDLGNASFHMIWIILATIAGTLSWILFSSVGEEFSANVITRIVYRFFNIQQGTQEAIEFKKNFIDTLDLFPYFGMFVGVILTAALSVLTIHTRHWLRMISGVVLRCTIAGICGYVFFLIGCIVAIFIGDDNIDILIDWIPWAFTGIAIALCSTIGTKVKPRKYWIPIIVVVGFVSMFIWEIVLSRIGVDYRVWLLVSHVVFSIGVALSIAHAAPVSEAYFLHVTGTIKDTDIALYKWFSANSNRVVTVGRSVDCDLTISWDVNGDIAPVQANITKRGRRIYITPLEDGVFYKGKSLTVGKPFRLYHGTSLTIGKTEMSYLEKDIS